MSTSRGLAVTASLLVLLAAGRASADVPAPTSCSVAGQSCNTAQTSTGYNGAGTCEVSTCAHTGPLPDGAIGTTQNPCNVCVATASSSSGGADASTPGGGSSSSGGCAAVGASPGFAPFALVAAGAAIVALSRRRRARR